MYLNSSFFTALLATVIILQSGFESSNIYKPNSETARSKCVLLYSEIFGNNNIFYSPLCTQSRGWANERHVTSASSKRPAQLAGLYPRKGRLAIGADADLVLWSETDRRRPVFTVVCGRIAVQYGKLRESTPRDRAAAIQGDEDNSSNHDSNRVGYVAPGQTPCVMLAAVQDRVGSRLLYLKSD